MRGHLGTVLCAATLAASFSVGAAAQPRSDPKTDPKAASKAAANAETAGGGHPTRLTIKDLMESMVDPSADIVWGAVGAVADRDGLRDLSPKTPEEWLEVRRAAVRLVEAANLLMMSPREAAPAGAASEAPGVELEPADITALIARERGGFDAFAMALQDVGLQALRAAEANDKDRLIDVGGAMEEVCESCHQTFWYPPRR